MAKNKSNYFLSPILQLSNELKYELGAKNTYMVIDKEGELQSKLALKVDKRKLTKERIEALQKHDKFDSIKDKYIIFKVSDFFTEANIRPFSEGKYSEMSATYRDTYIPKMIPKGLEETYNIAYLAMTKSQALRNMWEERLGVKLPKNAEVWSKVESNEFITLN